MVAGTRVLASSRDGKMLRPPEFADGSDMGCERQRGQGASKVNISKCAFVWCPEGFFTGWGKAPLQNGDAFSVGMASTLCPSLPFIGQRGWPRGPTKGVP